jgi:hypothetical protein
MIEKVNLGKLTPETISTCQAKGLLENWI